MTEKADEVKKVSEVRGGGEVTEGTKPTEAIDGYETSRSQQDEEGEDLHGETLASSLPDRQPADFNHPPAPGRARLITDEHFVTCTWLLEGRTENPILIPQSHVDVFERMKDEKYERLKREHEEKNMRDADRRLAEQEARDEERRRKKQAEDEQRTKAAERAKVETAARKLGLSADPHAFRLEMELVPGNRRLQVFQPGDVQRLAAAAQTVDADIHKRNEEIAQALELRGPLRRIGLPLGVKTILALREEHPHFGEVIEFVANHVALQLREPGRPAGRKRSSADMAANLPVATNLALKPPVRLPPLLLFGPPGVGKTHFCEALARVLGVPVRRHPMDQAETSSALLGSDMTWSNSRYGLVFEMLGLGDYANPVVILDELDKARTRSSNSAGVQSPTSVLHSLLEPVSAARVRDISVDLELDASQIIWIATANYPWWVPETLRSRMREFLITMPDAEQAIQVARSVVRSALKAAGMQRGPGTRAFVVAVAHLSPREVYQATMAAAAAAVRRGGEEVLVTDLPREVLQSAEGGNPGQGWLH